MALVQCRIKKQLFIHTNYMYNIMLAFLVSRYKMDFMHENIQMALYSVNFLVEDHVDFESPDVSVVFFVS